MSRDIPNRINDDLPAKVMIVGAGLGGLLLALLLEKMGNPYHIYERAPIIKPLGALLSLSASIIPIFVQLGLFDRLMEISLPIDQFTFYDSKDMKIIADMAGTVDENDTGYAIIVFVRAKLYKLLLEQIPAHKITFNKKVLSILQNEHGVMVLTSDNCHHHGDILVGADGAYSAVQQSLYASLKEKKILPIADKDFLAKGFICVVGTTDPLDPAKYPVVKEPRSQAILVIAHDRPYNWSAFTVPGGRISWNFIIQQTQQESEDTTFRRSQWGADTSSKLIESVRDFKTPYGTLGELIDATPKDDIVQVYLEDKMFHTWHYGRTVLIGDACHKLLPSAGQGAVNALQDAVILANCIRDLNSASVNDVNACFADFREQRFEHVKKQYKASKLSAKLIYGHTRSEKMLRNVLFNLPKWIRARGVSCDLEYQPQITFLPRAPQRGKIKVIYQKPSKKGLIETEVPVSV